MNTYTALIYREGELYVAECPEIGSVSQGKSIEQAIANLRIATELYLEETIRILQGMGFIWTRTISLLICGVVNCDVR